MRKWHRWLAVIFGVFLLWISITGLLSQVEMWQEALGGDEPDAPAAVAAVPAGFVCPDTMTCRPKAPKSAWNFGLMHHLHSGESFGFLGTVIATLSGFALMFFSFSGLWLYVRMWSHRRERQHKPAWFWK